ASGRNPCTRSSPSSNKLLQGTVGRTEARAEQVRARDRVRLDRAVELLLDDERLAVLDPAEPVPDVQAVADVRHVRSEELELRRVREPAGDQGRRVALPASLPDAGRDQRPQLGLGCEATGQRAGVLLRYGRHE